MIHTAGGDPNNGAMDDFAFLSLDQRRDALLALSKTPEAPLGALGLEPADAPIYVTATEDDLIVGTHQQCLSAAAASLGMTVLEPIQVQGANDAPDTYEVWADLGGSPTRLASATTETEALSILQANLEMLAGHMAMSLPDWLDVQNSDPFSEGAARARRGVQWAHLVSVELVGRVHADGWVSWQLNIPPEAERVRHKQARHRLLESGTLRRIKEAKTVRRFELRAVELEGDLYANFHDLSRAARSGVDVSALRPWPYFDANAFVINREYQRYLRAAGWRMLWSGEEAPGKRGVRSAAGATWLRDSARVAAAA